VRVLLVKMSSLGDVVHTLPALTDAAAHGIEFDWVVEEAFADIPARHPAVANVLPIGWRRWRGSLAANRRELAAFVSRLRGQHYDLVLDAQGLIKSGVVAAIARGGCKAGLALGSAREGAAAVFYERRIAVERGQHAIDRLRQLFAGALGYAHHELPLDPDFGIAGTRSGKPLGPCVLLHGTTWASKHYPESMWIGVARHAAEQGFDVAVPWGNPAEQSRAERIASAARASGPSGSKVAVWERTTLAQLIDRLGDAALAVGVDSGLAHLSAALNVPTVVVYGSTNSALTGCRGARVLNLQAEFPCAPCLRRDCGYAGDDQRWQGEDVRPACYSRLAPEIVWRAATEVMDADRVLSI
jgi:heptosyltransferase-1